MATEWGIAVSGDRLVSRAEEKEWRRYGEINCVKLSNLHCHAS